MVVEKDSNLLITNITPYFSELSAGAIEYSDCISRKGKTHPTITSVQDTPPNILLLKFWIFGKFGVPVPYNYSQVKSEPEWYYLLAFHP